MTKTIYFGKYEPGQVEEMGIDAYVFEGAEYEYKMEIYPEDRFLRIFDSVGRLMPVDYTAYDAFSLALDTAIRVDTAIDLVEDIPKVCSFD